MDTASAPVCVLQIINGEILTHYMHLNIPFDWLYALKLIDEAAIET
jgi:hypothetical protein